SVLLGSTQYRGRPFPKHMRLPITQEHFSRWLELFFKTVDELFEGETANAAKERARNIAHIFQLRMGLLQVL
ncbi:MAG: group III truncated hemoglobin, partial [Hymenobacteraceae bacterium]|nr:group III truncated hemoglobin [Hymenobacteraceae bacterium]MDX5396994.1 group III truncated hemoglobin [Hymenobacteraceae bacterium]MDX5443493.1 group III truncated hemoglobin [Hymenobacteraceae bacterium]MDX5513068.1 group III truncated hemoglobin [Hymenobacteraceae bacterium]